MPGGPDGQPDTTPLRGCVLRTDTGAVLGRLPPFTESVAAHDELALVPRDLLTVGQKPTLMLLFNTVLPQRFTMS